MEAGGGYWTQVNATTINTAYTNVNIPGTMSAAVDVCTETGTCLSNVSYQTNIIEGNKPGCPNGTSIIMKAFSGIWYTNDSSVASWEKVICGKAGTSDGTPMLVKSKHTEGECRALAASWGAAVVSDPSGNNMCRFNTTSCDKVPGGWKQYNSWTTTTPGQGTSPILNCTSYTVPACSGAVTKSHVWGNTAIESGVFAAYGTRPGVCTSFCFYSGTSSCAVVSSASLCTAVGCNTPIICEACGGGGGTPGAEGYYSEVCGSTAYANVTQVGCF